MPVKINSETKVATISESDSVFGKAMDGLTGLFGDDALTSGEAFWGTVAAAVGVSIFASKQTRANVKNDIEPLLGVFF